MIVVHFTQNERLTVSMTVVVWVPIPFGRIFFFIFHSGNKTKSGVKFYHSKMSQNWAVLGEQYPNTKFSLPSLLFAGYNVKF